MVYHSLCTSASSPQARCTTFLTALYTFLSPDWISSSADSNCLYHAARIQLSHYLLSWKHKITTWLYAWSVTVSVRRPLPCISTSLKTWTYAATLHAKRLVDAATRCKILRNIADAVSKVWCLQWRRINRKCLALLLTEKKSRNKKQIVVFGLETG